MPQTKEQLLADWWRAASESHVPDAVMLAHRRSDVADLNEAARALMREAGRLGERALVAGDREFRPGDRVVCRRNDPDLGVRNGTRATVREVEPLLGIVTLQIDAGPSRQLPERYVAKRLEHGYALTGHAAQGTSVEKAFVLVRAEGALASGAMSPPRAPRARRASTRSNRSRCRAGLARDEHEPTARALAGALSRSAAEPAATERLETTSARERALAGEEPGEPLRVGHARVLGELAKGGPSDPGPELRQLGQERERLDAGLPRAEAERARAERARAAMGRVRMVGRAGQGEAALHERAAAVAASHARDLTAALADNRQRLEVLAAQGAAHERWDQERLPAIPARLERIEHDLAALASADRAISAPLAGRPAPSWPPPRARLPMPCSAPARPTRGRRSSACATTWAPGAGTRRRGRPSAAARRAPRSARPAPAHPLGTRGGTPAGRDDRGLRADP